MLDTVTVSEEVCRMDPLPQSAVRLAGLIANRDEVDILEIVEVISLDQALTTRLLRVANSAASGSRSPVSTVKAAAVRMGTGAILAAAVSGSVRGNIQKPVPFYRYSEGQLWRHSVASALAAERLLSFGPIPPEAMTAALLHDIGKLVLCRLLDDELIEFMRRARADGGRSAVEAEDEILGLHSGEVGALLVRHWNLPECLAVGIQHHRRPDGSGSRVADIVHLADIVAARIGEGLGDEPSEPLISVLVRLELTDERLEELEEAVRTGFEAVLDRYEQS